MTITLASAALVTASALSWGAMGYTLQSLEDVWQDRVEALADLHETTAPLYRVLPSLTEVGHPVAMDSAAMALAKARIGTDKAWRAYLATTLTEAEVALMNQTTGPVAELHAAIDSLVLTLNSGDHTQYVRQMNEVFLPRLGAVARRMEALVALQRTVTRERVDEARRRYKVARRLLGASVVIAVVLIGISVTTVLTASRSRTS